nr:immunoglobulin light chain junction region [Macaca mulatta]MOX22219.1 immunoglobulin light chain junction region [Macaca mulatta]
EYYCCSYRSGLTVLF